GRAPHLTGQAVRPDPQRFDLQPADVSQGFADDDPCSQMRILSFALQEGVVIEGSDKAIGLEVLFADQACHRPGQSSIRAKEFQLNVQLDRSACQVDDLATDTEYAPWCIVPSDHKRRAPQLHLSPVRPDPLQETAAEKGASARALNAACVR